MTNSKGSKTSKAGSNAGSVHNDAGSVHHHHDHQHNHHHSHYERDVDEDGTVRETTVIEKVFHGPPPDEDPEPEPEPEPTVAPTVVDEPVVAQPVLTVTTTIAPQGAQVEGGGKKKKKNKGKKTTVEDPAADAEEEELAKEITEAIAEAAAAEVAAAEAVEAVVPIIAAANDIPVPGSPAPSHRSRHSSHRSHHHHPEVVVNVHNAPAQVPAPVVAAPALVATSAPALVVPTTKKAPAILAENIPLPKSVAPSPAASLRSMKLPKALRREPKTAYVEPIPEEDSDDDDDGEVLGNGEQVVTKVVTTTTTTRRPTGSPEIAPPPPPVMDPRTGYVENDPGWRPTPPKTVTRSGAAPALAPAPPLPAVSPDGSPQRYVERTTVETIAYPFAVDTAATTVGNATTKGIGGGRKAMLSPTDGAGRGAKAGLPPIPYGESYLAAELTSMCSRLRSNPACQFPPNISEKHPPFSCPSIHPTESSPNRSHHVRAARTRQSGQPALSRKTTRSYWSS